MTKLLVTRGLPASGKTTWATNWVNESPKTRARVSRDDLRQSLFNAHERGLGILEYDQEQVITDLQDKMVRTLLENNVDVVVDNTHLRTRYIRQWRTLAKSKGHDFELHDFHISVDTAVDRDALRERKVGEKVIRDLAQKFYQKGQFPIVPIEQENLPVDKYIPNNAKPPCYIVDIDGTVANAGDRHPHDLSRVGEDTPHKDVVRLVNKLYQSAFIVFLSGREDSVREDTEAWLEEQFPQFDDAPLHMRRAGDNRRDTVVKRELFDAHIRNEYNVVGVIDDRPSVVRMWRDLGLTTFAVGDQSVEF